MPRDWTTSGPMLHLALAPHGGRRAALETALRAAIRDGRLGPGTRLPSTRALAADLGLARGTVVDAFAQLAAEGYVDARRGAGTWVMDLSIAAAAPSGPVRAAARPPRFSFHSGAPDLTAFPHAAWAGALRQGLRRTSASSLGYGDPRGRRELREELAWYLGRARGVVADPASIVICGGFRHGLSLVARALRAGGADRLAMEDPTTPPHRDVVRATGLALVPLPVDAHGARTDLLATADAAAVVLSPAHQFPTGVVLHPDRRAAAIAWATAAEGLIIEDDYDAELRYDRHPVGALQALAPTRVVYGGTASKTLVPGLRLGWLVVPPPLLDRIVKLREVEDIHASVFEQIAFCEFLRSGAYERHVRRARARYRARRDKVVALLAARAPALTPVGIAAGLAVLLELPDGAPGSAELIAEAAHRSIEVFPLDEHYDGGRAPRDGLLIGYGGLPDHDFDAGLAALGDLLATAVPPLTAAGTAASRHSAVRAGAAGGSNGREDTGG